jgi:hypothetical protein
MEQQGFIYQGEAVNGIQKCARSWTRVRYSFLVPNRNGENVCENRFASNDKKAFFRLFCMEEKHQEPEAKLNEQFESGAPYHGRKSKDLFSRLGHIWNIKVFSLCEAKTEKQGLS